MGIFDWLFGKSSNDSKQKKPKSATEEWIEKGGDMTEMIREIGEESGLEDMTEEEKKEILEKDFGKLTKNQIKDRQVYAAVRAYGELMKVDGEIEANEVQLMSHFVSEEHKKLSRDFDQKSDEFKYVWAKDENFYECLKTYDNKQFKDFFEKLFAIASVDEKFQGKEIDFLVNLYMEVKGTDAENAQKEMVEMFNVWRKKVGI